MHAEEYKTEALHVARGLKPQILIGVGNLHSDAASYGANDILPIIHHASAMARESPVRAVVLPDWESIEKFFEANAEVLQNPCLLAKAIAERHVFVQPGQNCACR